MKAPPENESELDVHTRTDDSLDAGEEGLREESVDDRAADGAAITLGISCWCQILGCLLMVINAVSAFAILATAFVKQSGNLGPLQVAFFASFLYAPAVVLMLLGQGAGLLTQRPRAYGWWVAALVVGVLHLIATAAQIDSLVSFGPGSPVALGIAAVAGVANLPLALIAFSITASDFGFPGVRKLVGAAIGWGGTILLALALAAAAVFVTNLTGGPTENGGPSVILIGISIAVVCMAILTCLGVSIWGLHEIQAAAFGGRDRELEPTRADLRALGMSIWLRFKGVLLAVAAAVLGAGTIGLEVGSGHPVALAAGAMGILALPAAGSLCVMSTIFFVFANLIGLFAPGWCGANRWNLLAAIAFALFPAIPFVVMPTATAISEALGSAEPRRVGTGISFLAMFLTILAFHVFPVVGYLQVARRLEAATAVSRGQSTLVAYGVFLASLATAFCILLILGEYLAGAVVGSVVLVLAAVSLTLLLWLELSFLWTLQAEIYSDEPLPEGLESA